VHEGGCNEIDGEGFVSDNSDHLRAPLGPLHASEESVQGKGVVSTEKVEVDES